MNTRSIGVIGSLVILVVPFLGFHIFTLVIGLDQLDKTCSEPVIPMPYWLIGSAGQGLSFFVIGCFLLATIYWLQWRFLTWFFSGLILLNLLFQFVWAVLGTISLFTHIHQCIDNSELVWIVVLVTVILQVISVILTLVFKIIKECCLLLEPPSKRELDKSIWN